MTKWYLYHRSGYWGTSEKELTCLLNLRVHRGTILVHSFILLHFVEIEVFLYFLCVATLKTDVPCSTYLHHVGSKAITEDCNFTTNQSKDLTFKMKTNVCFNASATLTFESAQSDVRFARLCVSWDVIREINSDIIWKLQAWAGG